MPNREPHSPLRPARCRVDQWGHAEQSGNEDSTVSIAADQLKLAKEAMREPVFREVVAQVDTAVPGDARKLHNTNTLLNRHGVIGIKTGSGTAAGGNLMWASRVRGRLVLGVILGQAAGTNPVAAKAAALEAGGKMSAAVEQWLLRQAALVSEPGSTWASTRRGGLPRSPVSVVYSSSMRSSPVTTTCRTAAAYGTGRSGSSAPRGCFPDE
ncbi:D-alanyl-D-alanine carboxypeptidase family protein [Microtetraspora malaysiensis]|uniref:Peptidase S11 D-alanyl-D-alanine carboxypeptidase A N-terminal domain-containing protein n=1 Tax=Microtetraspora malaysiensis TaxID=161358 RepID=A0ABW6T110_9ACTN